MNSLYGKVIKAGMLVGTLDILSAFTYYFIKTGKYTVYVVFKLVASGVFGKAAYTGGLWMCIAGFVFHYLVAFSFTVFFFWLYPKIKPLSHYKIITGIIYGIFVWTVMNRAVIPFSSVPYRPFSLTNAMINIAILILAVGIPLSFMASLYYKTDSQRLEIKAGAIFKDVNT